MAKNQDLIIKLIEKLEQLYKKQADFNTEINTLREELYRLKSGKTSSTPLEKPINPIVESPLKEEKLIVKEDVSEPAKNSIEPSTEPIEKIKSDETISESTKSPVESKREPVVEPKQQPQKIVQKTTTPSFRPQKSKSNLEKFIGENLLNKIGIIITIIGVAIGAKYSIENDLISPLTRIILGYLTAIGLLGFGMKLKKNYEAYSAVLVSGSIVILYFITFFAYSFYDLIPQIVAFVLMVMFTVFTIVAAISYNRQIIAHLGLVGAYAIPFFLSDGSGKAEILFSYIAIINIGILITSFKKYWKSLYYSAFGFTWLIFGSWYAFEYNSDTQFALAFSFLFLFFAIFYLTFLAYKLLKSEKFTVGTIIMLMLNSFVFYGFGYALLSNYENGDEFLGLFTLGNAILHFIATAVIYKQKLADRNLFYLASGLVLVFITLTIPVQLDGNWVTMLWAFEAALLFWIGRTKQVPVYEKLSYPLMLLAFLSLTQDWSYDYDFYYWDDKIVTPIFNIYFLNSLLFLVAFGYIGFIFRKKTYKSALNQQKSLYKFISFSIPAIFIFTLYYAFRLEISGYWEQLFQGSELKLKNLNNSYANTTKKNYDLVDFRRIWILNYTMFFVGMMALVNFKFIKNKILKQISIGLAVASILAFLVQGLYLLSELRESYLNPSEYYETSIFHLVFRYVSFVFLGFILYTCYKYVKQENVEKRFKILYDLLLHTTIVWVLSSELFHWMDIYNSSQTYKLGLSILWGMYSFLLIAFGIWKNKKYLRVGGIGLFGITLIKLFFYDIAHLNTIAKTIVFVALGILLLIISFLYNKYKTLITDEVKS